MLRRFPIVPLFVLHLVFVLSASRAVFAVEAQPYIADKVPSSVAENAVTP